MRGGLSSPPMLSISVSLLLSTSPTRFFGMVWPEAGERAFHCEHPQCKGLPSRGCNVLPVSSSLYSWQLDSDHPDVILPEQSIHSSRGARILRGVCVSDRCPTGGRLGVAVVAASIPMARLVEAKEV